MFIQVNRWRQENQKCKVILGYIYIEFETSLGYMKPFQRKTPANKWPVQGTHIPKELG